MHGIKHQQPLQFPNKYTQDVELGGGDASIRGDLPTYEAVEAPPPSYATVTKNAAYDALTVVPFGVGKFLQKVAPKPAPLAPSETNPAGNPAADPSKTAKVASVVVGTIVGSAVYAPFSAAGACLANVTGSWVMRLHHSQEAFAFHGGAAQGNYALAGAAAAVPVVATLTVAKACLSKDGFKAFSAVHTFVAPFA